jgi:SAM-dependent methyltransferase
VWPGSDPADYRDRISGSLKALRIVQLEWNWPSAPLCGLRRRGVAASLAGDCRIQHLNSTFVRCDVCRLSFPASFFDAVICLSSLEHVGLGVYGDTWHEPGDLAAVRELCRVLKSGGTLILSTPYDRRGEGWQCVYDSAGIVEPFSGLSIEKPIPREVWRYLAEGGQGAACEMSTRLKKRLA